MSAFRVGSACYCPCDVCCGGMIGEAFVEECSTLREALEEFRRQRHEVFSPYTEETAECFDGTGWIRTTGDADGPWADECIYGGPVAAEVSLHGVGVSPGSMIRIARIMGAYGAERRSRHV